jgi:MoaA/NifB/PqqE/SkfB family radical SAM enzyme
MQLASSAAEPEIPIRRFTWDLTYACPLRCVHCYSESGRRPARTLSRSDMLRVVRKIIDYRPRVQRFSFAGGEPLLTPWWDEAARLLKASGIPVTVFVGGWLMDDSAAEKLADAVSAVTVSVDGADAARHDAVRGRSGSFARAVAAIETLDRIKQQRLRDGGTCYELGVDYTMTRTGKDDLDTFVEDVTSRFPALDYVRIGAAMPVGLAQEMKFVDEQLLTDRELDRLMESEPNLVARARNGVAIEVTDIRSFLPTSPLSGESATIAQIEPDGELRAFAIYEAKVGNILQEPIDVLWQRALDWRRDPFVQEQTRSIKTLTDWARVTRALDRRYGSEADKERIARRAGAV